MVLSAEYVKWKQGADGAAVQQKITISPVLGAFNCDIKLSSAFRRHGDVDNRIKAIPDWCQRVNLVVNDRLCQKLSIEWSDTIDHDCLVTLTGEIAFASQWDYARHQAEVTRAKAASSKRKWSRNHRR